MEPGIRLFRSRLVSAIRDGVLRVLNDPKGEALNQGVPTTELGHIADMSDDQLVAVRAVVAVVVDRGIAQFLYSLDNQPDGLEVCFKGTRLNVDGMYCLSSSNAPLADHSSYDRSGKPKNE